MTETNLKFPKDFLLGAACSAHQTEGNNTHSDWWHYEQIGRLPKSGLACDFYNRYVEDFDLARRIGLNSIRISIEWARIEPEEGRFDHAALGHYLTMLREMKTRGLIRTVTLQHFTLPQWIAKKGGWEKNLNDYFGKYAQIVAEKLGSEIDLFFTINEPEVSTLLSYVRGVHPPFKQNIFLVPKVIHNMISAHKAMYRSITNVLPGAKIGIVKNNVYYEPYRLNHPLDRIIAFVSSYFGNHYILRRIRNQANIIGLNYYFTNTVAFSWTHGVEIKNTTDPKSDMGWRTYPKGLYYVLSELKQYHKPVYVTENGIANARDDMRKRFIREHLESVKQAMDEGLDVRGYYYWSLTDNYEWHDGFGPRFGLIEINYETLVRTIRSSAVIFKELL